MTTFADLDLIPPLQQAVADCGYESPTPIQEQAIPPLLEGRDLLGCAQTGTGKTAAFALPALQHLAASSRSGHRHIQVLVLSPTRELAAQIGQCFHDYGKHLDCRHLVIHGGVNQNPQVRALRRGIDVLVATPGRLLDLMNQGEVHLNKVTFLVLDEADRMLDMGFVRDVEKVMRELPRKRQSALFSATLPETIIRLSGKYLQDPIKVAVTPEEPTLDAITQVLYYLERGDKRRLLAKLLQDPSVDRAIVFVRTKHGANRLVKQLDQAGIESRAIHGNKSQGARTRALDGFRDGSVPVLVATDVAARGIDVGGVTHVVQVDLPSEPKVYVHRIGRTGRADRDGIAICFCDSSETDLLREIERLTGRPIRPVVDHAWHSDQAMEQRDEADRRSTRGRPQKSGGGGGGGGGRNRGGGRRGGGHKAGGRSGGGGGGRGGGRGGGGSQGGGSQGGGSQGGGSQGGGSQGGGSQGGGGPPRRKRNPRS